MKKLVPILIGLFFIFITIYLSFNFDVVTRNTVAQTGFGWVITTILLRILVSLSFARGAVLITKAFLPKIKSFIVFIPGILIGFFVSFITPIYQSDYGDFSTTKMSVDHESLSNLTEGRYHIKNQPYILTFFTSDCSHCKNAAKLLGFSQSIGNTPQIIAVFPGTQENADKFINENNGGGFEYYTVDDDDYFIQNSGAIFPSIYLIDKDGNTLAHWFGDEFNFTALDYVETFSK